MQETGEVIDTTPRTPEQILNTMTHLATIDGVTASEYEEAFEAWANCACIALELEEQGELSNDRKLELVESARER